VDRPDHRELSRRHLVLAGLALPAAAVVAACNRRRSATSTPGGTGAASTTPAPAPAAVAGARPGPTVLPATPSCGADERPTQAQTEGPYFKPDSPAKSDLAGDVSSGTRLVVTGSVLTTSCQPVARALLDVWQADPAGSYDNSGFRLRGHFFTDDAGRWRLQTVVPGLYPGRTRHIHVKVQAPGGRVLTTQLYFPGEAANRSDSIYRPELLLAVQDEPDGAKEGAFTFVLA
jgi:protocatechuate 3,4-dioxygenase beta subunit